MTSRNDHDGSASAAAGDGANDGATTRGARHRQPARRRRLAPVTLAAGAIGSLALAMSATGTLSAFTASIQNSVNTATTGTLTMQETSGATTCNSTDGNSTNSATFASINKFGGGTTLTPGGTGYTTSVTIKNTGTITPASSAPRVARTSSPPTRR